MWSSFIILAYILNSLPGFSLVFPLWQSDVPSGQIHSQFWSRNPPSSQTTLSSQWSSTNVGKNTISMSSFTMFLDTNYCSKAKQEGCELNKQTCSCFIKWIKTTFHVHEVIIWKLTILRHNIIYLICYSIFEKNVYDFFIQENLQIS